MIYYNQKKKEKKRLRYNTNYIVVKKVQTKRFFFYVQKYIVKNAFQTNTGEKYIIYKTKKQLEKKKNLEDV